MEKGQIHMIYDANNNIFRPLLWDYERIILQTRETLNFHCLPTTEHDVPTVYLPIDFIGVF